MITIEVEEGDIKAEYFIEREIFNIKEILLEVKKKVVEHVFDRVVRPDQGKIPFDTGRYTSSHRIGIGKMDKSSDTQGASDYGVALGKCILQKLKLDDITLEKDVFISNSVKTPEGFHYAGMVEYSGWTGSRGARGGPYMVYNNAAVRTIAEVDGIIEKAIAKHDKS
jgi:hypothetical protein